MEENTIGKKVTRLCIIDENGRQYDRRCDSIWTDTQDHGKTLKIFINIEKKSE